MKKSELLAVLGLLTACVITATLFLQGRVYYPHVVVDAPENIRLVFLRQARHELGACQSAAATIANVIEASCPDCQVAARQCLTRLDPEQERLLSDKPLGLPSANLADGVIAYRSADTAVALAACQETERQTSTEGNYHSTCYSPNTARSLSSGSQHRPVNASSAISGLLILILSALASAFVGHLIVRYEAAHARWSHDRLDAGPQKFHATPTPRIGGLCVVAGLLIAAAALFAVEHRFDQERFGYLMLAAVPAFLGGIMEDVTKRTSVLGRLGLTMLAATCGIWLLGGTLQRLDIPGVDTLLLWMPLAIAFTIFAVSGVANAVNIIDGYNGLAGGYAVVVLAALAYVSAQVGDSFLLVSTLAMMGALLGFLVWNYPKGRIFLGDGGAYLVGFWLAEISVLLVVRHPEVSPWFPLLLLGYPVFETLYSIYRRKLVRGDSPGHPDRLHLHQLIYMRLVKVFVGTSDPDLITRRNSMVAPYIWTMGVTFIVPALFIWDKTGWLVALSLVLGVCYVWLYRRMVTWRAPVWLIRHEHDKLPRLVWRIEKSAPRGGI